LAQLKQRAAAEATGKIRIANRAYLRKTAAVGTTIHIYLTHATGESRHGGDEGSILCGICVVCEAHNSRIERRGVAQRRAGLSLSALRRETDDYECDAYSEMAQGRAKTRSAPFYHPIHPFSMSNS
jgi:hypothetical protein